MMIREITKADRTQLLELYTQLHTNQMPADTKQLDAVWERIIDDRNHHIVVAIEDDRIVSSCVCVIVPNLTQNLRPYALIENVITAADCRGRGLATACLNYARELAAAQNCYKMMLLTGSKDPATLEFYRRAGYNDQDKTAFIQWL